MLFAYITGAAITGGVVGSANRVTGPNKAYTAAVMAAWPLWWLMYGLTQEH